MIWLAKNKTVVIVIVVILLVVMIMQFGIKDDDKPDKVQLMETHKGGDVPATWSPDAITKELFNAIDGADAQDVREAAFARFNGLNDNQKILVYNKWLDLYHDKRSWMQKHGTLTEAIRDEWLKGEEGVKALGALESLQIP